MDQQGIGAVANAHASSGSLPGGDFDRSSSSALPIVTHHADWRRELRHAIVKRVLPRLSQAPGAPPHLPRTHAPFTLDVVERFAQATLSTGLDGLLSTIDGFLLNGAVLESVFLDLLSPAARHLGDLWLADRLSFFDVTSALGRLQAVVRALGPNFERFGGGGGPERRILLSPVAGEQHVFGLSIVAAFFRRAGWTVAFEPVGVADDLIARVRTGGFDAVGLSAAGDGAAALLPLQIAAIRRASGSRGITILAGGPAFLSDPNLARKVGADAVARDATEAVRIADGFGRRVAA